VPFKLLLHFARDFMATPALPDHYYCCRVAGNHAAQLLGRYGTLDIYCTNNAFQPGAIASVHLLVLFLLLLLFTLVAALGPRWCSQVYKHSNNAS
jgi:hypothetical protein